MLKRLSGLPAVLALLVAAAIWLPLVHFFFRPAAGTLPSAAGPISPLARSLAVRHLQLWEDPAARAREIQRMRSTNAEWDFMGRTYLVLALANLALREPPQAERYLQIADTIIEETLALEREKGLFFFLMDYARHGSYQAQPARSTFLDGEIALMLAARQRVAVKPSHAPLLRERIDLLVRYLAQSPSFNGESYPDECWMFCNAITAAAVKISDQVDGRNHADFLAHWLAATKAKLIDPATGLLVSSFTYAGEPLDGPEGSSIWMVAHCLQVVDPAFAEDQYHRARQHLAKSIAGFGYAREWPKSWEGRMDVDSGPIVPLVGASAGSSGLAILAAAAFHDGDYLGELLTTLNFAAFPSRTGDALRYAASNQVGDSVLLYALVQGPLFERVVQGTAAPTPSGGVQ
jgi:hypothetical protein